MLSIDSLVSTIQLAVTGTASRVPAYMRAHYIFNGKGYDCGVDGYFEGNSYESDSNDFPYIHVYYDDGSDEIYDCGGGYDYIELLEGPGTLQFVREFWTMPNDYIYFLYIYTENEVSTAETKLSNWYTD